MLALLPLHDWKLSPGTVLEITTGLPPAQLPEVSRNPITTLIRAELLPPWTCPPVPLNVTVSLGVGAVLLMVHEVSVTPYQA